MAESIEYRPPTQSQNPNMFMTSMPNCADRVGVGRDGDEVLGDGRLVAATPSSDPLRARCAALVIVSSVVNVLDETMNSVSAGSRSRVASAKSVPSTLETNRKVRLRCAVVRSAS